MNNEMLTAALAYAANGWKVFPLLPGKKIPMTHHGVNDATDDVEQIETWWKKTPTANIGLACGRASKVYVVDIDKHGDTDGFLAANTLGLPETLTAKTPNGGEHRFYSWKTGEEPAQAQKVNGYEGIDVRANGGYVVIAPSVVDGKVYSFTGELPWYDQELAEYPSILKKRKTTPLFPWNNQQKTSVKSSTSTQSAKSCSPSRATELSTTDDVRDRASAYLATMDSAIQGSGGHNALLRAAEAMVVRFALDDATALDLLWNEYNPRCMPPWDRSSQKDVKDFERKIAEAKKNPPHAYGDLRDTDSSDIFVFSAEDEAIADRLIKPILNRVPEVVNPDDVVDYSIWSKESLTPPGFIGELATYIRESAFRYQPVYALGGAIALASAMLGRRITDEYGTRTNLYCALIGPSSSGKDYPLKTVANILAAAGAESAIGSDVTCDTVIENDLEASPAKIYIIDEAGYFFSSITDSAGESSYRKSILSTFMKLFSSANGFYFTKAKVGKPRKSIKEPCVSMICNSTPRKMYSSIRRDQLEDGWIPRCLFFTSNKIPEKTVKPAKSPDTKLVDFVRNWMFRFSHEGNLTSINGLAVPDGLQMVHFTRNEDARKMLADYDKFCDDKLRTAGKEGNECDLLFGKSAEIVSRLALLQAACRDFNNTTVTAADVFWAKSVAQSVIESMRHGIESHVADSETEKQQKSILRAIEESGSKGISWTDLWRRVCRGLDKKRKEALLDDLLHNQEAITMKIDKTATKPRKVYFANKELK